MAQPEDQHETPPVSVHAPPEERRHLRIIVLLFLSAGSAYLLGRILWPFATALMTAVVLAVMAHPPYRWLRDRTGHENVAAFLGTTGLFFLVFLPLVALSFVLFNSIQDNVDMVSGRVGDLLDPGGTIYHALSRVASWLGVDQQGVISTVTDQVQQLGGFMAGRTLGLLSGLGGGVIQAGVALFSLFYLLRDGEGMISAVGRVIPLSDDLTDALIQRSGEVIYATVYGHVVVAIAQGTLGGLAFWILGIPGPVLWGTVMVILSLLPAVGPPIVWGPASIILLLQGHTWKALALAAIGGLVIGTIDNPVRSYLVSDRAQLHPLVVFFSVLGGIVLFGLVGVFLGPILFVASLSILEVTRLALDPDSGSRSTE
jgi:predicted PurR-regulated permease PerM